ncbi:hypothetical protein MRX96_046521 [Rhipicephalus microplus]
MAACFLRKALICDVKSAERSSSSSDTVSLPGYLLALPHVILRGCCVPGEELPLATGERSWLIALDALGSSS